MNDLVTNLEHKPISQRPPDEGVNALFGGASGALTLNANPHQAKQEPPQTKLMVRYNPHNSSVFFDSKYVTRSVPGRILWRVLKEVAQTGRHTFTNQELRRDPSLLLPPVRDNLETRLLLLRRVLESKFPHVRMCRTSRGHFRVEVDRHLELQTES